MPIKRAKAQGLSLYAYFDIEFLKTKDIPWWLYIRQKPFNVVWRKKIGFQTSFMTLSEHSGKNFSEYGTLSFINISSIFHIFHQSILMTTFF